MSSLFDAILYMLTILKTLKKNDMLDNIIPLFREAANGGGKQSFLTSQGDKKRCRWKQHNRVLIKTPKETGSFSNNDKENQVGLQT